MLVFPDNTRIHTKDKKSLENKRQRIENKANLWLIPLIKLGFNAISLLDEKLTG